MHAVIRIQTSRRPISGEIKGYRLQATVPNKAARKSKAAFNGLGEVTKFTMTKEEIPSFKRPYLIHESSDLPFPSESDFKRFIQALKWEGYVSFEFYGEEWEDCEFDLAPYGGPMFATPSIQDASHLI